MPDKVYEMPDEYKQAMKDLLEYINTRDELAATIKFAPPEKIREGRELLAALDKEIEEGEAALAKEYELYQTKCRLEEEQDALYDDLAERMVGIFIHIKYRHPENLEEIRAAALNVYTPEEEQAFYDRVAILEAGDLISIIAREGETREQTEEFLKNYRAANGE